MPVSNIYQQTRVTKDMRVLAQRWHASSFRRTVAMYRSSLQPDAPHRLLTTIKLASRASLEFALGDDLGRAAPSVGQMLTFGRGYQAACRRGGLAMGWQPGRSYELAALGAALLVTATIGTGAYEHEVCGGPVQQRFFHHLERYGLLGLPEAACVYSANKFAQHQHSRAASACFIGAILCAVPLEAARLVRLFALFVAQLPLAVVLMLVNGVYSVGRACWDPKSQASCHILFLDKARLFHFRQWLDEMTQRANTMSFVPPQQRAQSGHRLLRLLTPLMTARGASGAQRALHELCGDSTLGGTPQKEPRVSVEDLEAFRCELAGVRARQLAGRLSTNDHVFLTRLFDHAASAGLAVSPWEQKTFHRVALRLHPDKLMPPGLPVSPRHRQVAAAAWEVTSLLRELFRLRSQASSSEAAAV